MVRVLKSVGQMQQFASKTNNYSRRGAARQSCPLVVLEKVKDKQQNHQTYTSIN